MRTHHVAAALLLAAFASACGRQDSPTAAQAKATSPQPAADLATAPQPYQRMRFVSELEQSPRSAPINSTLRTRHAIGTKSNRHDAISATRASLASLVKTAPVAVSVASAAIPAPSAVVAGTQVAPPVSMPAQESMEVASDRGHGLGVMIRGGVGPNGKCDPRSEAQASGMLAGRPNSAMPLMPSMSVFGRH